MIMATNGRLYLPKTGRDHDRRPVSIASSPPSRSLLPSWTGHRTPGKTSGRTMKMDTAGQRSRSLRSVLLDGAGHELYSGGRCR